MSKIFTKLNFGDVAYSRDGKHFKGLYSPGLYDANGSLVASWYELVNTYGMNVEADYNASGYRTEVSHPTYILNNNSELANGVKLVIGDVDVIGYWAFGYCSNLTRVIICDGVRKINQCGFGNCTNLASIEIPDSVREIGTYAFQVCSSLTSIELPKGIDAIKGVQFANCSSLESIVIPKSVTNIGVNAFSGCDALTDVYYTGTENEWKAILIDDGNTALTTATIHYNYVP